MSEPWTPGPWAGAGDRIIAHSPECEGVDSRTCVQWRGSKCVEVVDPGGYVDGAFGGIANEADTRLIALAPEMAALLASWVWIPDQFGAFENTGEFVAHVDALCDKARDLLARARGEV